MAVKIERGDGMEVTFVGRVLRLREYNGYDDSDFYALVWDDEKGAPREVEYATTRGWTYNNSAAVDADDETLAKYEAWLTDEKVRVTLLLDRQRAATLERGKTVTLDRTVRSRKNGVFEKGETGHVFWLGVDQFKPHYGRFAPPQRAGVEFADGRKHFFSEHDLTVQVDETALRTATEIRGRAMQSAAQEVAAIRGRRMKVAA